MPRVIAAALVALLAASDAWAQCGDGSSPPCAPVVRPTPTKSIAVLGFAAIGGNPDDVLLGEGLAEDLTSRLAQLGRLTVTSRSAVRRLRNVESMPLDSIGRALGSAFLVRGTMRRAGGRLRITAELLRASSGALVWSDSYDGFSDDILAVQDRVSTRVAEGVGGRLLPTERSVLAGRSTSNAEAYRAYLRGRALFVAAVSRERIAAATFEFQTAVRLDVSFASAWSWLSTLHSWTYFTYFDRTESRLDSALAAAAHARALAPSAGLTHLALGNYYYWGRNDYHRALEEFSAALKSDPAEPQIHIAIANVSRRQGNFEVSVASRGRAIDLDPTNGGELLERAATLRVMRRFDETLLDLKRAMAMGVDLNNFMYQAQVAVMRDGARFAPGLLDSLAMHAGPAIRNQFGTSTSKVVWRFPGPHQQAALLARPDSDPIARLAYYHVAAVVYDARGDTASAKAAFDTVRRVALERLLERPDDSLLEEILAQAYAGLGRCDDALAAAEKATTLLPISRDAFSGPLRVEVLAEIEAHCGLSDRAIDRLHILLGIPSNITRARLLADPAFAPLRGNPRFAALVGS